MSITKKCIGITYNTYLYQAPKSQLQHRVHATEEGQVMWKISHHVITSLDIVSLKKIGFFPNNGFIQRADFDLSQLIIFNRWTIPYLCGSSMEGRNGLLNQSFVRGLPCRSVQKPIFLSHWIKWWFLINLFMASYFGSAPTQPCKSCSEWCRCNYTRTTYSRTDHALK